MNGGYVTWDDKILTEFSAKLYSKESSFVVSGLYSRLRELSNTGKVIHASTLINGSVKATFTFNIVAFGDSAQVSIVFIAGDLIAFAGVGSNDTCTAKYTTIGG